MVQPSPAFESDSFRHEFLGDGKEQNPEMRGSLGRNDCVFRKTSHGFPMYLPVADSKIPFSWVGCSLALMMLPAHGFCDFDHVSCH